MQSASIKSTMSIKPTIVATMPTASSAIAFTSPSLFIVTSQTGCFPHILKPIPTWNVTPSDIPSVEFPFALALKNIWIVLGPSLSVFRHVSAFTFYHKLMNVSFTVMAVCSLASA